MLSIIETGDRMRFSGLNNRGMFMLAEFKAFIAKGNVLDLAVAVIIGGAFALITSSLTDDVIMPIVGATAMTKKSSE